MDNFRFSHKTSVYQSTSGYNPGWFEAYNAAKSLGGYLRTFTSFAEWNSVYVGMLQLVSANPTIWIGMAKMSWRAGAGMTADVIDWITGEHSTLDYTGKEMQIFGYTTISIPASQTTVVPQKVLYRF